MLTKLEVGRMESRIYIVDASILNVPHICTIKKDLQVVSNCNVTHIILAPYVKATRVVMFTDCGGDISKAVDES